MPGEIGVLLGGVLASQAKLPLWAVLVAGISGAIVGDSVGHAIGKKYGPTLLSKIPDRIPQEEHLDRAQDSIRRNGGKAVFVGRFTAALRVLVSGLSGMSHVPYRTFAACEHRGRTIWAGGFDLLGYAAGSQYQRAAHNATLFSPGHSATQARRVSRHDQRDGTWRHQARKHQQSDVAPVVEAQDRCLPPAGHRNTRTDTCAAAEDVKLDGSGGSGSSTDGSQRCATGTA